MLVKTPTTAANDLLNNIAYGLSRRFGTRAILFIFMKYLLIILSSLFFYSCTNDNKISQRTAEVKKDSLLPKSDSFNFTDLYLNPSIQDGILLDTTTFGPTKKYLDITIVLPKLSKDDCPGVSRQLNALAKNSKKEFIKSIEEPVIFDTTISSLPQGYSMWIEPKSLYKTDKVLSFAVENGEGYSGMKSVFEFITINFDIKKKKKIMLEDYFILNTSSDTAWFADIVCKSLNWGEPDEVIKYLKFFGPVKFAFDEENIYFFFDRGELFADGQIGSVKKKYIANHIKYDYR